MTSSLRYQWLGDIPDNWDILKISHTTYVKGRIGWHGLNTDDFIDDGPYCVTGTDLKNGVVDWSTCYHVSYERYEQDPFIQLREHDLLLTKDGTIGKCGIVDGLDGKATLNSGLFVIRTEKDSYITRFLYWIIQSQIFDNFITLTKTGTTISHLYQNVFERFRFPVPIIETQKQIADFLDKETTRIDTLITKKQKQIGLLQEKRQAIITQSVTKGLDENVKMKDSGVEWIGEVPEHWNVRRLKFMVEIKNGRDYKHIECDKGYPIYGSGGKFTNGSDYLYKGESVLLGRKGTIDKPIYVNEAFWTVDTMFYTKMKSIVFPKFFFYSSLTIPFNLYSTSTALPSMSQESLLNHKLYFPSIETQKQISDFLDKETTRIDTLNFKKQKQIELLQEKRQAIITHAVSGQIDISKYEVSK